MVGVMLCSIGFKIDDVNKLTLDGSETYCNMNHGAYPTRVNPIPVLSEITNKYFMNSLLYRYRFEGLDIYTKVVLLSLMVCIIPPGCPGDPNS
jgi:hypothetical protein